MAIKMDIRNLTKLLDRFLKAIEKLRRKVSRHRAGARAVYSKNTPFQDIQDATDDVHNYITSINTLKAGLEALKLGDIYITYSISGSIRKQGALGLNKGGRRYQLVETSIRNRTTRLRVVAYSFRGYRSRDPEQGGGIEGVVIRSGF